MGNNYLIRLSNALLLSIINNVKKLQKLTNFSLSYQSVIFI